MSVAINDTIGILRPLDRAAITATAVSSPFRVKVLFEKTSKPEMQQQLHRCVDTPATICIGVDPVHHYTFTEFGVATQISPVDFQDVGRAGTADFRQGHWASGVMAIIERGVTLRHYEMTPASSPAAVTPVIIEQPRMVVERPIPIWPFVVGFGILMACALVAWRLLHKQAKKTEEAIKGLNEERFEYASRNIMADDDFEKKISSIAATTTDDTKTAAQSSSSRATLFTPTQPSRAVPFMIPTLPTPSPPSSPTVIVDSGRGDDRFFEGMMMGEVLSRPIPEPARYREVVVEEPVRREPDSEPAHDAGGSGSDFSTDSHSASPEPSFSAGSSGDDFSSDSSSSSSSSSDDFSSSSSDSSFDSGGGGGDF